MRLSSKSGTPFSLWLAVILDKIGLHKLGSSYLSLASYCLLQRLRGPKLKYSNGSGRKNQYQHNSRSADVNSIQRDRATIFSAGAALALLESYPDPQFRDYFKKCDDAS